MSWAARFFGIYDEAAAIEKRAWLEIARATFQRQLDEKQKEQRMTNYMMQAILNLRSWMLHANVEPGKTRVVIQCDSDMEVHRLMDHWQKEVQAYDLTPNRFAPLPAYPTLAGIQIDFQRKPPIKDGREYKVEQMFSKLDTTTLNTHIPSVLNHFAISGAKLTDLKFEYVISDTEDPKPMVKLIATGRAS